MYSTSSYFNSSSEEASMFVDRQECVSSADTRDSGDTPSSCCRSPRASRGQLLQGLQQQTDYSVAAKDNKDICESPTQHDASDPEKELLLKKRGGPQPQDHPSHDGCDRQKERGCMHSCCCCSHSTNHHCKSRERYYGVSSETIDTQITKGGIVDRRCCCCNGGNLRLSSLLEQNDHTSSTHLGKWQKILWKKQPHPDCYVDETFLNTLMRNANVTRYTYSDLCKSTVVLTQHLSCILIFLLIYRMIIKKTLAASTLVVFNVISLPLGYALRWSLQPAPRAARQVLQSAIIVFGVLRILAPVLQTLTQSFSDDTVISLTSICLLIHIPLNDYSYVYRNPETIDEPLGRLLSLNLALFANVLLASRLSTSTEVFAFLFFGIEVFALAPMARRYLLLWSSWACTYVVTPFLILLTSVLVYLEGSGSNVLLYLLLMFFITFVGPYWLIRSQKYKNEISGPWDIPCVKNYT